MGDHPFAASPMVTPPRSFLVRGVAVILVTSFAAGAAFATSDSLPYDPLHEVKTASEQARLALARSPIDRVAVELDIAEARLREAAVLQAQERPAEADAAVSAYGERLASAAALLQEIVPVIPPAAVDQFRAQIVRQQTAIPAGLAAPIEEVGTDSALGIVGGITAAIAAPSRVEAHEIAEAAAEAAARAAASVERQNAALALAAAAEAAPAPQPRSSASGLASQRPEASATTPTPTTAMDVAPPVAPTESKVSPEPRSLPGTPSAIEPAPAASASTGALTPAAAAATLTSSAAPSTTVGGGSSGNTARPPATATPRGAAEELVSRASEVTVAATPKVDLRQASATPAATRTATRTGLNASGNAKVEKQSDKADRSKVEAALKAAREAAERAREFAERAKLTAAADRRAKEERRDGRNKP